MTWEARGNRRYYYLKRRVGTRVVSNYVPAGLAERVADVIAAGRLKREAEHTAWLQQRADLEQIIGSGAELEIVASVLVRLALSDAGYHHHKGEWRRRRNGEEE